MQDGFSGEVRSGAFQIAADGIADAEKADAEVRRILKIRSEQIEEKRRIEHMSETNRIKRG